MATISNPATFSSVRTAFDTEGYGSNTSFYAYRQGGGIVPATATFNAIGAGTAGDPLQLSQFSNFSVPQVINITNHTIDVSHTSEDSGASSGFARIRLATNGILTLTGSTSWSFGAHVENGSILIDGLEYWAASEAGSAETISPANEWIQGGDASIYSARATITSGSMDGPTGWNALTSEREWSITKNSPTPGSISGSCTFTLDIAKTADTATIIDSATITLSVFAESIEGGE